MMADHTSLVVRTMRAGESDAVRDVTLGAYEEYAAITPGQFWTGYRRHLLATPTRRGRPTVSSPNGKASS